MKKRLTITEENYFNLDQFRETNEKISIQAYKNKLKKSIQSKHIKSTMYYYEALRTTTNTGLIKAEFDVMKNQGLTLVLTVGDVTKATPHPKANVSDVITFLSDENIDIPVGIDFNNAEKPYLLKHISDFTSKVSFFSIADPQGLAASLETDINSDKFKVVVQGIKREAESRKIPLIVNKSIFKIATAA